MTSTRVGARQKVALFVKKNWFLCKSKISVKTFFRHGNTKQQPHISYKCALRP